MIKEIENVKQEILKSKWEYSVYSKILKALEDELELSLSKDDIYSEQLEIAKNDYLFSLIEKKEWVKYIPYNYVIEAYDKGLFILDFKIEPYDGEIVIYLILKIKENKIDEFIKFVADCYYDVDVEDVYLESEYIDNVVYDILDIVADAIRIWDKKYYVYV